MLEHAGQVGVADVVAVVGLADGPLGGELVAADEPPVAVAEREPPVIPGRGGCLVPAVGHRRVEVAEEPQGAGDRPRVQRPAAGLAAGGTLPPPLPQERLEVQRHGAQPRGIAGQGRAAEPPGDGEPPEAGGVYVRLEHRRPGDLAGFHLQARVELGSFPQPGRLDVVPADHGVPVGLVRAPRDPLVEPQAPQVVLPPRRVAVADRQPGQQPAHRGLGLRPGARGREPPVVCVELAGPLGHPLRQGQVRERAHLRPGGGDLGRGGRPPSPVVGVDHPLAVVLARREPPGDLALHRDGQRAGPQHRLRPRAERPGHARVGRVEHGARERIRDALGQYCAAIKTPGGARS